MNPLEHPHQILKKTEPKILIDLWLFSQVQLFPWNASLVPPAPFLILMPNHILYYLPPEQNSWFPESNLSPLHLTLSRDHLSPALMVSLCEVHGILRSRLITFLFLVKNDGDDKICRIYFRAYYTGIVLKTSIYKEPVMSPVLGIQQKTKYLPLRVYI